MQFIKEVSDSNSQSCTLRIKDKFHCNILDSKDIRSAMEASFSLAIENYSGNVDLKGSSPHHRSCQKRILTPLPTCMKRWFEKVSHPFRIYFHRLRPYELLTSLDHQPPHKLPYFASTTLLQKASLSNPYLQSHLPRRAWLKLRRFLIANPPLQAGSQILGQLTRWNLNSVPKPLQRKSLWSFSNLRATSAGIGNNERK